MGTEVEWQTTHGDAPSVNVNAPAGGDGSKDLPFQTIQAAIDAANADYQTIEVAPGTDVENPHLDGKKVQVRSLKGAEETIIISATPNDYTVIFNGDMNLDPVTEHTWLGGFTIRNGALGGVLFLGDPTSPFIASSPVLVNCVIEANAGQGISCFGSSSPRIINCKILNNSSATLPGGGLYCAGSSAPQVSHCTFNGNLRSSGGGQIHARNTAKVTLINCVVWSAATDAEIATLNSGQVKASYSDIRGSYTGLLNRNADNNGQIAGEANGKAVRFDPIPPALAIRAATTNLVISWSPNWPGVVLEAADDLSAPEWQPVATDGTNLLAMPPEGPQRFFRLNLDGIRGLCCPPATQATARNSRCEWRYGCAISAALQVEGITGSARAEGAASVCPSHRTVAR